MKYPGGKEGGGAWQRLVNEIPPHRVYVEPFCGGAAVFRNKRPAELSILADLDPAAVAAAVGEAAAVGVAAGEISTNSLDLVLSASLPSLEGRRGCRPAPTAVGVVADGIRLLKRWPFTGDEFVYCDPPYLASVRRGRSRRIYRHEMGGESEHKRLLAVLRRLPCRVMISGYWSALYDRELAGWRSFSFRAMTRRGPAVEWVWCNYPAPAALHDPRWIGADRRRRQDWQRFARRWVRRFKQLEPRRQRALLDELQACLPTAPVMSAELPTSDRRRRSAESPTVDVREFGAPSKPPAFAGTLRELSRSNLPAPD